MSSELYQVGTVLSPVQGRLSQPTRGLIQACWAHANLWNRCSENGRTLTRSAQPPLPDGYLLGQPLLTLSPPTTTTTTTPHTPPPPL
jgi:hypothetical protein